MSRLKLSILAVVGVLAVWLAAVMIIDATKLSGLVLHQQDENNYTVKLRGEEYVLRYVPKRNIAPLFGKALVEFGVYYALVRNDLPPRVQKSVAYHEIYHLYDFQKRIHKSRISREIHAMIASVPHEPLGFLQTVYLTLTSKDRLGHYFNF